MLYQRLQKFAKTNQPIKVALVGAGSMGQGIAWQVGVTPGMQLVAVCDRDVNAAKSAARVAASSSDTEIVISSDDEFSRFGLHELDYDVLVEATNSIGFAAEVCAGALRSGKHVVLMNAEVDLAFGAWLHQLATENNVVVTSDAGDQHGVLMKMMDEIQLWGFRPVMAGNIKGFLNRYATAESLAHEAAIRRLNPVQCCAYTDGTKLSIEMALIANATGMVPTVAGMEGPAAEHVRDVFHLFDFEKYPDGGVVDYILGAQPGGGVFAVGHCDNEFQVPYLKYYKLGDGPYYLFYRPYHLCHLETPSAIASAFLDGEEILRTRTHQVAEVYSWAKRDLAVGTEIDIALGGSHCYGMIDHKADDDRVPITLLEAEAGESPPRVVRPVAMDQPLKWSDIEMPETALLKLHRAAGL